MIAERPLIYAGPMVRSVLSGTKTKTRRVMARQKQHEFTDYTLFGQRGHPADEAARRGSWANPWVAIEHAPDWPDGKDDQCFCPYARERGDRLWVRETYYAFGRWETRYSAKKGRDEWHFVDMTLECGHAYRYAADGDGLWPMPRRRQLAGATPEWWKRPAIFMPRAASRILLEVTDLRIERLQAISEADAKAEGVALDTSAAYLGAAAAAPYRHEFFKLWESLYGADSWDYNPWMWVIDFRRIKP